MTKHVKFPSTKEINKAAAVLKQGGVVIFPTDTVFGIGCLFDKKEAVERIYRIKNRPKIPMPILISKREQLSILNCRLTREASKLVADHWPGALTVVLPCGNQKIGVRLPNYPPLLDLISKAGKPIIGTSANFHGEKPVVDSDNLNKNLTKQVDIVVSGHCPLGKESTVVDCSGVNVKIIRQGAVKLL